MPNFMETFFSAVPAHGRVLDVGAGSGTWALHLRGLGFDVVAIDRLPKPAELPMEIEWLSADLRSEFPSFLKGTFDGILARNVIQFLNEERVKKELIPLWLKLLTEGGVLGIETFFDPPEPSFQGLESFYTKEELLESFVGCNVLFAEQHKTTGPDLRGIVRSFSVTSVVVKN